MISVGVLSASISGLKSVSGVDDGVTCVPFGFFNSLVDVEVALRLPSEEGEPVFNPVDDDLP